jgi:general secretion pathway protein G
MKSREGFSLIELIFVIVIIGILSSFIVPKLTATSSDALKAKTKSQIATIRSAISLNYSNSIMTNSASYPSSLDDVSTADVNTKQQLFANILDYPITSTPLNQAKSGKWAKVSKTADADSNTIETYRVWIGDSSIDFIYYQQNGRFDCDHNTELCEALTQ